jgi:membrane protein DedA with SNARE-associated domain
LIHTIAAATASAPPNLPGFLSALSSPLQHYGVWAIILLVFLEDFGIPVPGETVLIAGAVYAGDGGLNIVAVGVSGFLAAILGDNVGYAIGRFGGRALVARWGRYVFLTEERLAKAEAFFNRHGGKIIVVARFIEGLRQANGIIAGITRMRWLRFVMFNAIGAALWVGCWVSVGYFAGQHISSIYTYITRYSLYALVVVVVVVVAWILFRLRKRGKGATGEHVAPAGQREAAATPEGAGGSSATRPGPSGTKPPDNS